MMIERYEVNLDENDFTRHPRGSVKGFAMIEGKFFIWVEHAAEASNRRHAYGIRSTGQTPGGPYWTHLITSVDPITGVASHLYQRG